jgi:asparagine synthase (glutamine-hydrolysing)
MRVDKMTMAHSIESRVPFLDHEVVEFSERVPVEYKIRDGIGKHVLKKAAEPFLDHDMIYRRKQGFGAPMESWFREPSFRQECADSFDRSQLAVDGLVDSAFVHDLLERQQSGGGWSFHLWTIMNAAMWMERWTGAPALAGR